MRQARKEYELSFLVICSRTRDNGIVVVGDG